MSDLKTSTPTQCPFCGSLAWMYSKAGILNGDTGWRVECEGECHAMTCYWHTKQQALKAWNRRTEMSDQQCFDAAACVAPDLYKRIESLEAENKIRLEQEIRACRVIDRKNEKIQRLRDAAKYLAVECRNDWKLGKCSIHTRAALKAVESLLKEKPGFHRNE